MDKQCNICKKFKNSTEFYKNKLFKLHYDCKSCHIYYSSKRILKRRLLVINHYTNGVNTCQWQDCNINDLDMLVVDHVNDNGAEHRRKIGNGGTSTINWIIRNNFPEGFQILCHNHNYKKEALRRRKNLCIYN